VNEKIQITIRPRADCKICWSKGTVRGCSVPVPFGSGSCSLPDEFCDCVIEQIPDDENEYDITLTDVEIWKAGNCGGTVVSAKPNDFSNDDSLKYYGGYLIAESIPTQKYVNLIVAAPEMKRVLDLALPIITAEADERDQACCADDDSSEGIKNYRVEMRELANAITAALYFAQWGVKPEPLATVEDSAEDNMLAAELLNIAEAHRANFDDAESFREWAQSRARHTLNEYAKKRGEK
jgi:hypothetical protein